MQAIGETLFDVVYLVLVVAVGIKMIRESKDNKQFRLFGIMAVTLGCGDAFHLVPRAYALCTTGLENFAPALGIGKFITSITMTVLYSFVLCMEKPLSCGGQKRDYCSGISDGRHPYCSLPVSSEPVDKRQCSLILGNLQKYPIRCSWTDRHRPVL